jgi:hypothetical protein
VCGASPIDTDISVHPPKGVTFVGAREQIKRQLKDLGVIPIPNLYISAAYVATLVSPLIRRTADELFFFWY